MRKLLLAQTDEQIYMCMCACALWTTSLVQKKIAVRPERDRRTLRLLSLPLYECVRGKRQAGRDP